MTKAVSGRVVIIVEAVAISLTLAGCPAPVLPTASFTATPESGSAPLLVQFADASVPGSSSIMEWSWDFGDPGSGGDNTSTDQNPAHSYSLPGTYTVSLTVTTDAGFDEASMDIVVEEPPVNYDAVIFVDASNASGIADGVSWETAFRTISDALAAAVEEDEIWVAQGIYMESLTLTSRVKLYGGFEGTEPRVSGRVLGAYETVVDASTANQGIWKADHVIVMNGVSDVLLDGFILQGAGDPREFHRWIRGAGIYCKDADSSNSIVNCRIQENKANLGGGVYCENSSPLISNCIITQNLSIEDSNTISGGDGGGIYCIGSSPEIVNTVIAGNLCDGARARGGAVFCSNASPTIINCVIDDNEVNVDLGGGVYCESNAQPTIVNTVLARNNRHAVYEADTTSNATVTHCLFHDNPNGAYYDDGNVSYSDVNSINTQVSGASNNIDGDPLFVDASLGDYHLTAGSLCIDAGTGSGAPLADIDGDTRPLGAGVDIGVDEYDSEQG